MSEVPRFSKPPVQVADVLKDPSNQQVLKSLEGFAEALKNRDIHKSVYSTKSLLQLSELSQEQKNQIIQFADTSRTILEMVGDFSDEENLERELFRKALQYFGLLVDESLWDVIAKDMVVEIYGPNMIQLYRSINFYQYTSYSLLDLSAFEWFILWDRPRVILDRLMKLAIQLLETNIPLMACDIPQHILREIHDTGLTENFVPRAVLHRFDYVASLTAVPGGPPVGFVCVSRGEIVAEGKDTSSFGIC
jgi:hypothetical protein